MIPVLIAGLIAMVAAVVIGPKFIELLRARNLGQQIRAEGPATHVVKQGTPTMGGLLILASASFRSSPSPSTRPRGSRCSSSSSGAR